MLVDDVGAYELPHRGEIQKGACIRNSPTWCFSGQGVEGTLE